MKILAIETSCDETALALIEVSEQNNVLEIEVLGDALFSQTIHHNLGGVVPMLAKREHSKNLVPLLLSTLEKAGLKKDSASSISPEQNIELSSLLSREEELLSAFTSDLKTIAPPDIDAIAVTTGPGLEPALWVGINFAKALSLIWKKPIIPINHMEGHIAAALLSHNTNQSYSLKNPSFPALCLLISGGHTELLLMKGWGAYTLIGETRDDAIGEAFDKVARMLGLPYPGGPHISRLAEIERGKNKQKKNFEFPRPMINSENCDFSFSGLKTAVLYTLKKIPTITEEQKEEIAREFEDAVTEVLEEKIKKALLETGATALIAGGGVTANSHIRKMLERITEEEGVALHFPSRVLSTDNAIMIAVAAFFEKDKISGNLIASGTLRTARE